jgi:hypothetical protein
MTDGTFVAVLLLCVGLLGCSTPTKRYDDSKIALITKGATTEVQVVEWFGAPTTRALSPDGSKMLTWRFAPREVRSPRSGSLEVRFGPDGKVAAYNAASAR